MKDLGRGKILTTKGKGGVVIWEGKCTKSGGVRRLRKRKERRSCGELLPSRKGKPCRTMNLGGENADRNKKNRGVGEP